MRYLIILSVAFLTSNVSGMFVQPQLVPAQRLIKNTEAAIKETPNDAKLYYNLARINYLAFVNTSFEVFAFSDQPAPDHLQSNYSFRALSEQASKLALRELGYESANGLTKEQRKRYYDLSSQKVKQLEKQSWKPEVPSEDALMQYADSALANFNKAIELDEKNGLYHLGLASLLEQYVEYLKQKNVKEVPANFRSLILENARGTYYRAYLLSIDEDMKHRTQPLEGVFSLAGHEAGRNYVRLTKALGKISRDEKKRIDKIEKNLKKLERLPIGAITPIIIYFERNFFYFGIDRL